MKTARKTAGETVELSPYATLPFLSSRLPRRAVGPERSAGEGSAVRLAPSPIPRAGTSAVLSNRSLENQRRRVHAVPQASWRRPIVKNVSEVRVTPGARDSRPHAKTVVLQLGNIFPRDRLPEAGPTRA